MSATIGGGAVLGSGILIVDGPEGVTVDSDGIRLALRWSREDDNIIVGGTPAQATVDLPRARPDVDVVHAFNLQAAEGALIEIRLHVAWIHDWARLLTYTIIAKTRDGGTAK